MKKTRRQGTRRDATRPTTDDPREASGKRPAQDAPPDPWIVLRSTRHDWPLTVPGLPISAIAADGEALDRALQPLAKKWNYVFGNRERLGGARLTTLGNQAREDFQALGLTEDAWNDLAASEFIEVAIRHADTRHQEDRAAARLFPWEQVLSAATWARRGHRLHVTRHLRSSGGSTVPPDYPGSLVTIACAPGRLAEKYATEFAVECRFVESILAPRLEARSHLGNPGRVDLQRRLGEVDPGVVHLACIDWLIGVGLVPELTVEEAKEGVLLADPGKEIDPVSAAEFGELLRRPRPAAGPVLVSFSTCYSACHSAALAVANGARLAIGFTGPVDGALAELFFSAFYRRWAETDWDALAAFDAGRVASLASPLGRSGQAVVLWSAESLLRRRPAPADRAEAKAAEARPESPGSAGPPAPETIQAPSPRPETFIGSGPECGLVSPENEVEAVVEPLKALNYSLLHCRRGLFRDFRVRNTGQQPCQVQVTVDLYTGSQGFPWRDSFRLGAQEARSLATEVEVPLLADLLRRAREGMRTTLFVEVKAGSRLLVHRTFGIELLSADEWRDEKETWELLASFVLPRDPTVARLVGAAERYLKAMADDLSAGFDGYQRVTAGDGSAVDLQVRALWAALQHDFPITYINPPPTYAERSQRVRVPSRIGAERRATCLDLALLMAACLEHIGIHPVVYLLEGHAFGGYWRDEGQHVEWTSANLNAAIARSPQWPLCQRYVQAGGLVPLETTLVTGRESFAKACVDGRARLEDPLAFDAMIDIERARRQMILPLPLESGAEPQRCVES